MVAMVCVASAQQQGRITPNFKDADITQIAEAVVAATGKNFIIDPRVRAQVTMLSSTPMTPAAFYEAFLSILQVHGFIAVQSGDVIKILPDANAELLLNGRSLGRRRRGPFEYRLRWDDVVYEPGTLTAVAYKDGQRWATGNVSAGSACPYRARHRARRERPASRPGCASR